MQSWDQEEIKALAHAIWLRQGCPEGRAQEHWQEAEELFRERWLADKHDAGHQVRDLRAKSAGAL